MDRPSKTTRAGMTGCTGRAHVGAREAISRRALLETTDQGEALNDEVTLDNEVPDTS